MGHAVRLKNPRRHQQLISTAKLKLHQQIHIPNKYTAQLLLNPYFSQYVHTSYTLSIPAYSAIGLPSELPLCLKKKTTFPSHIKLTPLRHLHNKCTKTITAVVSPYTT